MAFDQNYYVYRQDVVFTRPANTAAYTAGDVVSNNATTTVPMDFTGLSRYSKSGGYIVAATLNTNLKSITPQIRVHLYNTTSITVAGDNVAHKELYADVADKIGSFDFSAMTTPTDSTNSDLSQTSTSSIRIPYRAVASDQSIYAVLQAVDAFTPASGQSFTLSLFVDQA